MSWAIPEWRRSSSAGSAATADPEADADADAGDVVGDDVGAEGAAADGVPAVAVPAGTVGDGVGVLLPQPVTRTATTITVPTRSLNRAAAPDRCWAG